jgi:hypothetical protein
VWLLLVGVIDVGVTNEVGVSGIAYPFERHCGVFNGVREAPDLDGNLVEDVVVQGEVDAEESPRTRRPQGTFLPEGLGAVCEVLMIVQTVSL